MRISRKHTLHATRGFTLVELIVTVTVLLILSVSIVSFITTWLKQYSASSVRTNLNTDSQTIIRRMNDDVRKSTKLLVNNEITDPSAPTPPGKWASSANQLVLGQTPRTTSGDGIFDPPAGNYTGTSDSIIYYLNGTTLYRRIVPATNYPTNANLPLVSCTPASPTIGGCPTDTKIADNVKTIAYIFYTNTGAVTTNAATATAVKINLQLEKTQAGQVITTSSSAMMVFRKSSS